MRPCRCLLAALALLALMTAPTLAQSTTRAATAYALPLTDIAIDGNLEDWPEHLPVYPITRTFRAYAPGDLDLTDLRASEDLSPRFRVGWSLERQVIYVAVEIRDDQHTTAVGWDKTDAVEIYIDDTSKTDLLPGQPPRQNASTQYAGVAGGGSYESGQNPTVMGGGMLQGVEFAHRRVGTTTVYEWALPVYTREGARVAPQADQRLGFDVVAVDKDDPEDPTAWVPWGPMAGSKYIFSETLGDLVLLGPDTKLGRIEGLATHAETGEPLANAYIEVFAEAAPAGYVQADAQGRFRLDLPPGDYTLEAARMQGIHAADPVDVTVQPGESVAAEVALDPIELPEVVQRMLKTYRDLSSYRDEMEVFYHNDPRESRGMAISEITLPVRFAFERPNKLRLEAPGAPGHPMVLCDGKLLQYVADGEAYRIERAPDALTVAVLARRLGSTRRTLDALPALPQQTGEATTTLLAGTVLPTTWVYRLILSPAPEVELREALENVMVLGASEFEGEAVVEVELTLAVPFAVNGLISYGSGASEPAFLRLWIAKDSGLIRKTDFQYDAQELEGFARGGPQPVQFTNIHRHIEVNPKVEVELVD